jgi:translation initiation factor 2-alpha kinase 4
VGVSIGLDPVIGNMAKSSETTKKAFLKNQQDEVPMEKRCDVLVLAKGNDAVRMTGDKLATALWASDVSAELAIGRHHHDYNFVVTVRHEASSTVRVTNTNLDSGEADIPASGLVSYLQ